MSPERDRVRVIVCGECDLTNAGVVHDQLRQLERSGFSHIVCDLRDLGFMDCSGLRVVLAANRRARRTHGRLDVVGGGQVARLFALGDPDGQLRILSADSSDVRSRPFERMG